FFFSSRRRHTRSYGDWSSDVCSSDLDQEVGRVVGLSLYVETTSRTTDRAVGPRRHLRLRLAVNPGIHLGPLEQIFPVVATPGVIVGSLREPEVRFSPVRLRGQVRGMVAGCAVGGDAGRKDDHGAVKTHLDLKVSLRPAVVSMRPGR